MKQELPILYNPAQTARIMGISRSQVYNLLNSGELNSVQIGRSRRIAFKHIQDFIHTLEKAVWPMDNNGKVSDNTVDEVVVIIETDKPRSTNRNLSTSQFGEQ